MIGDRWDRAVGGVYTPPPCPPRRDLRQIVEALFQASIETEEGRPLRFMAVVSDRGRLLARQNSDGTMHCVRLRASRTLSPQEVRRLAPATNVDATGLWITCSEEAPRVRIEGIVDVGRSWSSARHGFRYGYWSMPNAMVIRVLGPGQMDVYQGEFAIAHLRGGRLRQVTTDDALAANFALGAIAHEGLTSLSRRIRRPRVRTDPAPGETEFRAYLDVCSAVVNALQGLRHGGIVVWTPATITPVELGTRLRMKYEVEHDSQLADSFVGSVNAHYRWAARAEGAKKLNAALVRLELTAGLARESLAEQCTVVARLGSVDGAIVVSSDLRVLGFGAEILGEPVPARSTVEELHDPYFTRRPIDIEQTGMRHRSSARAAWNLPGSAVFAVSQDGGITAFRRESARIRVWRVPHLTSSTMPWA